MRSQNPNSEDEIDELWNTFGTTVKALKQLMLQLPSMQGALDVFMWSYLGAGRRMYRSDRRICCALSRVMSTFCGGYMYPSGSSMSPYRRSENPVFLTSDPIRNSCLSLSKWH